MQKFCEFDFEFDDFQVEAIGHLEKGESVVVCAPTGCGKTVIAEYAVNMALKNNKRVFYTTPLKALSNQKFRDFQKAIGEENVGLLTGDVSINREAAVVVMTTEVFRNMLYGTNLGKVEDCIQGLQFVVLDECHYMNDQERGTVWEESIIYCPENVQIIALSATIANSEELTGWIKSVHNNTKLVFSNFRPVPLRHFHYINDAVVPLLSPGGALNKNIKKQNLNRGSIAKSRMRSPAPLIRALQVKNMLPAIYFCFSRKRCDKYLDDCLRLDLLNELERKVLAKTIDDYIADNPILAKNRQLEYIYHGVASHHAGLLPVWKALIEKLFQKGLIKVVFATETLAAGINMPARTTIISEISKRCDEGHRTLTGSEFLQMSGRAGRRGMDEVGYVVTLSSPFHEPREVVKLATSNSDPLNSQFTPTYSMVLNLLQRFNLEEARALILSSFGYYTSNKRLTPLYASRDELNSKIDEIAFGMCPFGLTNEDMLVYNKNKEKYVSFKRIYGNLKKQARNKKTPEVIEYKQKTSKLYRQMEASECHTCVLYKKHIKSQEQLKRYKKRLESLERLINIEKDLYWNQFLNLVNVLTEMEYVKDNVPTELGIMASNFKCENELYLVEVINSGYLDKLEPAEIAGVFCAIISEEPRGQESIHKFPSKFARQAINDIYFLKKKVGRVQRKNHVDIDILLNIHYSWVLETWATGIDWEMLVNQTSMAEGDIVRTIKRTVDILRQVTYAPYVNPELSRKCGIALSAINREPITELL